MTISRIFQNTTLTSGTPSANPYLFNDFIMRTNGLINIVSATTNSPPGSPSVGAAYIVASGASGAWTGYETSIAVWYGNTWNYISAVSGMRVHNLATDRDLIFTEIGTWFAPEQMFDSGGKSGTWTISENTLYGALYFQFVGAVNLETNSFNVLDHVYTVIGKNTSGSTRLLTFLAGVGWVSPVSSVAVINNSYVCFQFTQHPDGLIMVLQINTLAILDQ